MANYREVRDLLRVACFEDIIDDDEFLLLWDFPYEDYGQFDLDEMDDSECIAEFRVKKCDLPGLAAALKIQNQFVFHCDDSFCPSKHQIGELSVKRTRETSA